MLAVTLPHASPILGEASLSWLVEETPALLTRFSPLCSPTRCASTPPSAPGASPGEQQARPVTSAPLPGFLGDVALLTRLSPLCSRRHLQSALQPAVHPRRLQQARLASNSPRSTLQATSPPPISTKRKNRKQWARFKLFQAFYSQLFNFEQDALPQWSKMQLVSHECQQNPKVQL